MFGCHRCQHNGKIFGNLKDSPCATCATRKNPPANASDENTPSCGSVMHPAYEGDGEGEKEEGGQRINPRALNALARCVRALVGLKEGNLETYRTVVAQLDAPDASEAQLARTLGQGRKAIRYHLKKATREIPELMEVFTR